MSNLELKPCPCCGGIPFVCEEERGEDNLDEVWVVGCGECGLQVVGDRNDSPSKHFPDEFQLTVDAWNTRPETNQ